MVLLFAESLQLLFDFDDEVFEEDVDMVDVTVLFILKFIVDGVDGVQLLLLNSFITAIQLFRFCLTWF
jgi:hypothetical protein